MEFSDLEPPAMRRRSRYASDGIIHAKRIMWRSSFRFIFYAGIYYTFLCMCIFGSASIEFYFLGISRGIRVAASPIGLTISYGSGWEGRKGLARRSYGYNELVGADLLGIVLGVQSSEFGGNTPTLIDWWTAGLPWWIPMPFLLAGKLTRIRRGFIAKNLRGVRSRKGICKNCGYDLRATPLKHGPLLSTCPECGARI